MKSNLRSHTSLLTSKPAMLRGSYEATVEMRKHNDLSRSPIRISNWELLDTNLTRKSAHWTAGKSRMRISTVEADEFIITYNFRVALSKTAAAPPAWADELYASEQIIHSLSGFEVTSIKRV